MRRCDITDIGDTRIGATPTQALHMVMLFLSCASRFFSTGFLLLQRQLAAFVVKLLEG